MFKKSAAGNAAETPAPVDAPAKKSSGGPKKPLFTIKPSKKTTIILASVMGGTLAASAGLLAWQTGQIAQTETQVLAKQAQVADGEKISQRLQKVEFAYNGTQQQLKYLETSVNANEYVPTLLHQMEELAKSVNLKVAAVRPTLEPAPKPPVDPEARKTFKTWPYDKIHVDMDISGTYWDVAKMLYKLTEFPKIMSVESVQVSPQTQGDPTKIVSGIAPNLNVKLKLTGFIFPNDGQSGPLAPALPSALPSAVSPGTAPPAGAPAPGMNAPTPPRPPAAPNSAALAVPPAAPHL